MNQHPPSWLREKKTWKQEVMPQEVDLVCDKNHMQDFPEFGCFGFAETQKEQHFHPRNALTQDLVG